MREKQVNPWGNDNIIGQSYFMTTTTIWLSKPVYILCLENTWGAISKIIYFYAFLFLFITLWLFQVWPFFCALPPSVYTLPFCIHDFIDILIFNLEALKW